MKINWLSYISMGLAMLFVHPFLMLWELYRGRCSAGTVALVLVRSFITPLILYIWLSRAMAPDWLIGLLFGFWSISFVAGVFRMTILVRLFDDLDLSGGQFRIQFQGKEDVAEVSEEVGRIVEDLYGWRPGPNEIKVERQGENLVCDILPVVLRLHEAPGKTADKIRNELMRRRYGY